MDTLMRYHALYPPIWEGYVPGTLLGSGSFGDVYELKKEGSSLPPTEAFKEIAVPPRSAGGLSEALFQGLDEAGAKYYYEGMRQKALEEVLLLKKFSHCPNIVRISDHKLFDLPEGQEEYGWVIFVRMELLQPLKEKVLKDGICIKELCRMTIDLCTALEACHAEGIVHRDIKPENIFYSPITKNYKLGDFGIACYLSRVTEEKGRPGTLTHMAPEVYRGAPFDYLSDLYALGMVLYKFLNENRIPLLPDHPTWYSPSMRNRATHRRLLGEALPLPSIVRKTPDTLFPLLSAGGVCEEGIQQLASIAARAVCCDASKRFESASALKNALTQWQKTYAPY